MTKPASDLQQDLRADLLTDLGRPAALPSAPLLPPLPEVPTLAGTPCLAVRVTPLQWARPCLESSERGAGLAARFGPVRLEVCF